MGRPVTSPRSAALTALLAPYADSDLAMAGRLVDVPPAVAAAALQHLPPDPGDARPNGTQPPMTWLIAQAAALDGRLVGSLVPGRAYVRFDGIQVTREAVVVLTQRLLTEQPAALAAAVAEAWTSSVADEPVWTGAGTDLIPDQLPPGATLVGLWWD